jgi:site-specific DNA recombinase
MKVANYCRVSSDKQDTDLSISAQLRALRDHASRNGHEVTREFVDEVESGRTANRPAFKEMIALAKTKHPPFEAILVWKLNRFARNRADSITYKTLLRNKGIEVISINEPVDDSPTGRLLEGVIESIDEFYSANLGQDIRRGLRENASRGFFNGSRPPYGFRKVAVRDGAKMRNQLKPEEEDSVALKVVRRVFDMAVRDIGCKEIAKTLNREGFRTSKGERWGRVTVHKVLTNEAYCGTLVWGGRPGHPAIHSGEPPVRIENAWPAIIDRETFQLVQRKMASKSPQVTHPRTVPSFYLLSGLLFCSCGHAMIGHSAKSHSHFYYLCSRNFKQGKDACSARMLPKEKLERLVIEQLRCKVLTDENLEELVTMVNEELQSASCGLKGQMDVIDAELRDVRARLSKLYDALETGKLDLDDLAPRIRDLKARQDELGKAKVQIEADMVAQGVEQVDVAAVRAYAQDLRHLLEEADFTERKAFLRSFIKRIEVNGRQVRVCYSLPVPQDQKTEDQIEVLPIDTPGGDRGIRTPNLCDANAALSQLSYTPTIQILAEVGKPVQFRLHPLVSISSINVPQADLG